MLSTNRSATATCTGSPSPQGAACRETCCWDFRPKIGRVAGPARPRSREPKAYQVVAKIPVPEATNGLEQCQWSERTGLIYANVPEINGCGNDTTDGNVFVIDPHTMSPKVVRKFDIPVAQRTSPQGMAIGPLGQILLGCNAIYPFVANCNAVVACPPGPVQNAAVIDEDTVACASATCPIRTC